MLTVFKLPLSLYLQSPMTGVELGKWLNYQRLTLVMYLWGYFNFSNYSFLTHPGYSVACHWWNLVFFFTCMGSFIKTRLYSELPYFVARKWLHVSIFYYLWDYRNLIRLLIVEVNDFAFSDIMCHYFSRLGKPYYLASEVLQPFYVGFIWG